ncbi:heavy metal sensor histidine kinase [Acidicapsa acidisoli]|uniref:heavy metal sensor histidine kinase n=1 Tax=Acidicapsa acidisoli TaxID=1615681 RepID=UPI0021E07674|nr:heavy metal sensor histidine kinase [Acidicapsa acidisoli]
MSSKPSRSAWPALPPRRTLAFRLSAAYSLAGLLLVILATASLYIVLRTELDRSTELFLADKLHVLRTMLRERPDDEDALREEIELESQARRYQQFYIRLLDEHGVPIMTTPGMTEQLDLAELVGRTSSRSERSIAMAGRHGQPFRITGATVAVGTPATHSDTVQIAIDVSQEEELLARYRLWFWGILLVTSILFPLVGYRIARHGIRPVEEIAATARRITSTNLRERIASQGYPLELESLAGTFNEMLGRLEESFERISRFTADIAHDLRTPVNNIRGEAEVALARSRTVDEYRDVLESSLEESVRLSELIGDLLFLARAESPLTELHRESVNIGELLTTVRDYYEASATDAAISLVVNDGTERFNAQLDRSLMLRAVSNLVSNAIAHTPPGGTVTLAATNEDAAIRIEVFDTGVGIPAEALPRVFDRFFRVDPSRSKSSGGTGLGLAIVQSILTLHGGSAEITSHLGRGTRVMLRMPAPAIATR